MRTRFRDIFRTLRWALALRWAATADPEAATARRRRRENPQPRPLGRNDPVDWSAMTYVQVNDTDDRVRPNSLQAMMDGPFRRMLDLCGEDQSIRAGARVMEFARGPVVRFKDRHAATLDAARAVDEAVSAELERRFAHRGADGRYLIDVFRGLRTHNG